MKMKSKAFLAALCAVLLVCATMFGTLAYLTDTTDKVENTFTVGNLFNPDVVDPNDNDGKFVLYEKEATDSDKDGKYKLGDTEVTANEYKVLPGVALPKEAYVRTDVPFDVAAYVFVEVVDKTCDKLTVTVDTANWTKVEGVTGKYEGTVYALANGPVAAGTTLENTTILEDNEIAVADAVITNPGTVTFYGYACQAAGFDSAADAWAGAFGATE